MHMNGHTQLSCEYVYTDMHCMSACMHTCVSSTHICAHTHARTHTHCTSGCIHVRVCKHTHNVSTLQWNLLMWTLNEDILIIRMLLGGPKVSILHRFHCIQQYCLVLRKIYVVIFKPGEQRPACAWFLEIVFIHKVGMCACMRVCVCVCVCPPGY